MRKIKDSDHITTISAYSILLYHFANNNNMSNSNHDDDDGLGSHIMSSRTADGLIVSFILNFVDIDLAIIYVYLIMIIIINCSRKYA